MNEHQSNTESKMGSERGFGLVFGGFFAIIGLLPLLHGDPVRPLALLVSAVFFLIAYLAPRVLRVPNTIWFKFGLLLGEIVAPVVMALVYITTIAPFGLVLRLMGKDLLHTKLDAKALSYWITRDTPMQPMKHLF